MQREKLSSRLGFILVSAGCAIGIGNVWKFPWMAGQYGGGIFVLFYLIFLLLLAVPVLTMEFSMGRASGKSPIMLYYPLEPKGSIWHIHGYGMLAGLYLLMMFYTVVAGWILKYFFSVLSGNLTAASDRQIDLHFVELLSSPRQMIFFTSLIVFAGFLVCSKGLVNGLERVSKLMMSALLFIMVALAIMGLFLDGAQQGLKFYLLPDFASISNFSSLFTTVSAAMQQAFFTLSVGLGSMAVFGSFIGRERALLGEASNVAILDTFVAITSGLIIFPICFTYGVDVAKGPALIFEALPRVFNRIPTPFGQIVGSFFFLFLFFAAFTTVIAVFEGIISCCAEKFGWSKKKACIINSFLVTALSLPCIFGFSSSFTLFGKTVYVLDLEDFLVSNILLPLGALIIVTFCSSKRFGWGFEKFSKEANHGKGLKIRKWMRYYISFVLPIIVFAVFIFGLFEFFGIL